MVCGLCLALSYVLGVRSWRIPWQGLSLGLIVVLVLAAGAYLSLPVLAEDTETDIAAVASLAMRGLPVYPAPDAAARYMLLYGPLTYLSHIPFYTVLGENLFSFKLPGFLAFIATIVGLYEICRGFAGPGASLIGCGCGCVVLLRYVPIPFWGRIDSLLLGAVVVAFWIAVRAPRWLVVLSTALVIAIVPNLKFTAALYLLPLLAVMWMKIGPRPAILAAVLGALLFPLPFLLPEVSLANYLFVLRVNGRHGLDLKILLRNFQYLPIFLAPVLLIFFSRAARKDRARGKQRFYLLLIASCMALSCVFGAKAGAGSYHLLPYVAALVHLYFWVRASSPAADSDGPFAHLAAAWVLAMLIFSAAQVRSLADCLRYAPQGARVSAQIGEAEEKYRGRAIEVGVGSDFLDRRTLYAFIPVMQGQPYTINSSAIRDLQFGGAKLPIATLNYFERCGTAVWLIPAGQEPFTALNSYYAQPHMAFSEAFRSTFLRNYRRAETGSQFDTWVCKH